MMAKSDEFFAMLEDEAKQHSGQVNTLDGNTIYTMSLNGACFDYGKYVAASFKGDDSIVITTTCTKTRFATDFMANVMGIKFKMEFYEIPEFIANFVTPTGFFPDVIRRVSRIVSKVYTHPDQWEEVRRSAADCLSVCQNPVNFDLGAKATAISYQLRGINVTYDDVITLAGFMKRVVYDDALKPNVNKPWVCDMLDITKYLTSSNIPITMNHVVTSVDDWYTSGETF